MHLYYARFVNHFLHSIGLTSHQEPFKRLLVQGMVFGQTFVSKNTGRYLVTSWTWYQKTKQLNFFWKKRLSPSTSTKATSQTSSSICILNFERKWIFWSRAYTFRYTDSTVTLLFLEWHSPRSGSYNKQCLNFEKTTSLPRVRCNRCPWFSRDVRHNL